MNDKQSKDVEKNIRILSTSSPTSLITTPEKQENINSTSCNISTTKLSPPSNLPSNETESFILESGALMCAVTGTIPMTGRPTSESPINYSGQQKNNCISRQNSLGISTKRANNKQSTITTLDHYARNNDEEVSNENNVSNLNCDSTLSNYALRNSSSMQRMNHNDQNADCVGLQNVELIPPPTYNEATIPSSIAASEEVQSLEGQNTSTGSSSHKKKFLSSGNQKKSIDKALSFAAAPVATAAILVPSINNAQNCAIVTDSGTMDLPSETTHMLQDCGGSNEKTKKISMHEKNCSTPSSSIVSRGKILEKKQSESFISTPDNTFASSLRSKFRRKSQTENPKDSLKFFQRAKNSLTNSAKEVKFSSSDQINCNDEGSGVLGGVTKKTQNTFDLLAERCHGAKVKTTCSPSSSESPGSAIQNKTNYVLDLKPTPSNKNICINKDQGNVSDNLKRKSSLKVKGLAPASKNGKESKIESGRQFSDADLASAVAVATAAAAASDNTFAGKRSSYVLCSGSEPSSCVRSQYQTPNHVTISGKNSISSSIQSPTSVNNSEGATPDNARSKKVKSLWKKAATYKTSRMNSMTSDTESPKTKSLIFDVAEAEALMDEFGIVAPLSGLGNIQPDNRSIKSQSNQSLNNQSNENHESNIPLTKSQVLLQRKRSSVGNKSIVTSRKGSSRPLSPTAFDEVAEEGSHSYGYPLMDRNSTSDFDPETHNPRAMILDVGGRRHKVLESNFSVFPNTRLGKLARARNEEEILGLCDGYREDDGVGVPEYFFDRNWTSFNSILDIYRTGVLHLNTDLCALVLQKDLEYWQIDELILEPCCALKYYPEIEICVKEQKGEQEAKRKEAQRLEDENFGTHVVGRVRTYLWNLMEYPETSKQAQVMAFTSLGVVLISTMTFVLGTFPEFQSEQEIPACTPEDLKDGKCEEIERFPTVTFAMDIIDNIAVVFFLIEYTIRLACSPRKFQFFIGPMNLVDLFAILPFFLDLIIGGLQDFEIMGKAGKIVRLVRVMRIMRIFKLVRHFAGLQSLIYTLNQAYKELGLLMLLVGVAVLTFSSLVYFAEKDNPKGSWSFLDSFWWGLMTLTTVGYGDLSPSTFPGKLIGGLCALGGIFILTLPIPIVVNSFASYYKNRLWRNEVAYKKRQRARKRKEMELLMRDNLLNILTVPVASTVNAITKETEEKNIETEDATRHRVNCQSHLP